MLFAATSSHPMIVLEFRHVSMRLCYRAGEVDHAAHAVAAIVQQQGFKEACIVGHSFGTFVASRLCQLHPSLVQSLVSQLWAVRYITMNLVKLTLLSGVVFQNALLSSTACIRTVLLACSCSLIHCSHPPATISCNEKLLLV